MLNLFWKINRKEYYLSLQKKNILQSICNVSLDILLECQCLCHSITKCFSHGVFDLMGKHSHYMSPFNIGLICCGESIFPWYIWFKGKYLPLHVPYQRCSYMLWWINFHNQCEFTINKGIQDFIVIKIIFRKTFHCIFVLDLEKILGVKFHLWIIFLCFFPKKPLISLLFLFRNCIPNLHHLVIVANKFYTLR